jgi:hypothetical protein
MTDLRNAAQQALEALDWMNTVAGPHKPAADAIDALRAALAEPQGEPCSCVNPWAHDECTQAPGCKVLKKLTAPPQRQPLTDEQIAQIASTPCAVVGSYVYDFARAIERAHGIGDTP